MLLLTFRSDEVPAHLRHWLTTLDRERLAAELTLTRLTREEVEAMLRAIFNLPGPIRRDFLDAVFGLTEGNPFFVEEVLKVLVDSGGIFYSDGRWDRRPMQELRIPRSVQDAVLPRVAGLSEATRQTLTYAAVTGRRFNFALLQELTRMDAQLIVEESADQFAFRHALTREAVYSTLLLRERKHHHLAVAETLERIYAGSLDAPVGDLALHFFQAGVWDKAAQYSRQAGEKAQSMYATREAIEHFTRALDAAAHLLQAPTRIPLYRARGQAFGVLGDFSGARADFEAALSAARETQDRRGEWEALLDLGFLWASRDYTQAEQYFQESLTIARTLGDSAILGHTLNRVGNWHLNRDQTSQALSHHHEALEIFQRLEDKPGLAETYDLLGLTNTLSGGWMEGSASFERAIALFRELDDRQGLASALATYAERGILFYDAPFSHLNISRGDSVAQAEEALRLAQEIGWRSGEAYALAVLGGLYGSYGEMGRAFDRAHSALQIAQEIEHRQWTALARQVLGGLYLTIGELDQAQQYLEEALAPAHESGSLLFVRQGSGVLASTLISRGDHQALARGRSSGRGHDVRNALAIIWRAVEWIRAD